MQQVKLKELTQDLTSDETLLLLDILTQDIKYNRIKYNKKTLSTDFEQLCKNAINIIQNL